MSLSVAAIAVDDSPAVLLSGPATIKSRRTVHLRLTASDDPVYIGPAGVTASTGLPVYDSDVAPLVLYLGENDSLYGICGAAGTATVHVLTT